MEISALSPSTVQYRGQLILSGMRTISRSAIILLSTLFLAGCASRIPVNKPDGLIWWVGKRVRMKRGFNLVPTDAGRGAAEWRDSTAYPGENYPLRINAGQICTVVRFYRLTEGEGSMVLAVLRAESGGTVRDFEYMFLPDYYSPGRNEAEKVAHELSVKFRNRAWTLAE